MDFSNHEIISQSKNSIVSSQLGWNNVLKSYVPNWKIQFYFIFNFEKILQEYRVTLYPNPIPLLNFCFPQLPLIFTTFLANYYFYMYMLDYNIYTHMYMHIYVSIYNATTQLNQFHVIWINMHLRLAFWNWIIYKGTFPWRRQILPLSEKWGAL